MNSITCALCGKEHTPLEDTWTVFTAKVIRVRQIHRMISGAFCRECVGPAIEEAFKQGKTNYSYLGYPLKDEPWPLYTLGDAFEDAVANDPDNSNEAKLQRWADTDNAHDHLYSG